MTIPIFIRATFALLALLTLAGAGTAADRVAVAKCVSADGTIFRRAAPDKPWQVVKQGETLHSGDLLIGLPGAAVDSRDGAVRLSFIGDLGHTSPLPIVETAVLLNASTDADAAQLDFTMDRGRVDFTNLRDKSDAKVVSRVRDGKAEISMEPGTRCSLEVFGRWPAGIPFKKDAKPDYAPTMHLIFLVLKGEITLNLERIALAMKAPPGPALIEWDSVTGGDPAPTKLERVPDWAAGEDQSEHAKRRRALLEEFRQAILKKSIDAAIDEFLNSDDRTKRRIAINSMGAMDDLDRLATALTNAKHADVWDSGVLALRHWIGRGPGQDQKVYERLIKARGYTPVDAEATVQLLHSFSEAEVARPELYETLIDYLAHDKLAIRGLSHWHLVRLAPAGNKINYDPLAPKEARDKAIAEWHKLIPRGKMPPKPQPEKP